MRTFPDLKFEQRIWKQGFPVLGIDEAGRGAFAGPLTVGGVIFDLRFADKLLKLGINDSKLITPKRREALYIQIKKYALFSHVEFISLKTINEVGIGKATLLSMRKVLDIGLTKKKNIYCLTDAFKIPRISLQTPIIHGDRISVSIAAASILAKVERDKFMEKLAQKFPKYGFERHKGYGTLEHRKAISEFGCCFMHRTQFVRNYI